VTCQRNWGGEIVYYYDDGGNLCSLPFKWTSLAASDLFVSVSAGRAAFRVSDLLELSGLLAALKQEPQEGCDA
jgi:hypothetical protein